LVSTYISFASICDYKTKEEKSLLNLNLYFMKQREDTDILEIKLNILHKLFAFIYNSKTVQEKLSEVTKEEEDLLVSHNVDLLAFLAKIEDMHNEGSSELEALLRQECLEELAKIRDIILNTK
jgi:hypothetical protein